MKINFRTIIDQKIVTRDDNQTTKYLDDVTKQMKEMKPALKKGI